MTRQQLMFCLHANQTPLLRGQRETPTPRGPLVPLQGIWLHAYCCLCEQANVAATSKLLVDGVMAVSDAEQGAASLCLGGSQQPYI